MGTSSPHYHCQVGNGLLEALVLQVSFSSDSCLVLYALCAFCFAQLSYLLGFAVPAAFQ